MLLLGGMVGGVYGTLRRIYRKGQAQRRVERSGRKALEFARDVRPKRGESLRTERRDGTRLCIEIFV
jgi:hypothetical protein